MFFLLGYKIQYVINHQLLFFVDYLKSSKNDLCQNGSIVTIINARYRINITIGTSMCALICGWILEKRGGGGQREERGQGTYGKRREDRGRKGVRRPEGMGGRKKAKEREGDMGTWSGIERRRKRGGGGRNWETGG